MATPSAKDMLMQVQRYAERGDVQSEGLSLALARGLTQEQYDQNIREYASKKTNQLEALNAMSAYGISMADANRALGAQTVRDYFTVDPNIGEAAPSSVVQTNFTSPLQQAFLSTPDKGQAVLDARIREVAAQNVGNPEALRNLFLQNDASIADIQRAGVDPSILYSTLARTPPVIPVTPPKPVVPTVPNVYTPTSVYQPLAAPPPIYGAGQPALDVDFRNSAPRTYDPRYGYVYTPAASLRPATGAGMSFTPPSVTSRPRSLLNVELPVDTGKPYSTLTPAEKANLRLSASQYYARDRAAAQQLAALPGGRFSGMQAPAAPAIGADGVAPTDLRFYGGPTQTAARIDTPPTGGGLMGSGTLQLDQFGNPLPFAKGGPVKKSEGTADTSARAMLDNIDSSDPAPRNLPKERQDARRARVGMAPAVPQDYSGRDVTGELLNAASLATMPVPFLGDAMGLAADARMYQTRPEERTLGNYALSALGVLPFVPSAAAIRAGKNAAKTATGLSEESSIGLRAAQDTLARNQQDAIDSAVESVRNNGINMKPLMANPQYWDAEYEQLTDKGFAEYDRLIETEGKRRANIRAVESLEDLNGASHNAQADAFYAIAESRGLNPSVDYSLGGSRYITLENGTKFRFADHGNTVRDTSMQPDVNVAPDYSTFTDALARLPFVPSAAAIRKGVNAVTTTPKFIDSLPGRNELSWGLDGGEDAVDRGFPEEPFILLDRLYIDPQNRGKGVAKKVLKEGLQDMADQYPGMDVRLLAQPLDGSTNTSDLVRLYESMGFDVDDYQDGMSGVPMSLTLPKKKKQAIDELARRGIDVTQETGAQMSALRNINFDPKNKNMNKADGGLIQKYRTGGGVSSSTAELTAQMDRIGAMPSAVTPDPAPTREQTESRNMLSRLAAASAVDQEVYKTTGMEPGLDRASILPLAGTREQGNLQFAAPQMLYDLAKAAVAPGVAASGRQVSNEDALNTALNLTGGSFGASGIAGPVGENILGMAVKPRGGVFRPTITEGTVQAPSGIDNLVDGYRRALVREGTVPTEQIDDIVAKARRYFTTAYGTAKDPLRLAILEGTLNPTVREYASGFYGVRPRFRDYLLEAARRDYATEQGVAAQVEAGTLAAEAPLRTSQSLEDFERLYDEGTGLRGTVYREEGNITPDMGDVLFSVRDQLEGEGVPKERINPNINSRTPTGGLRDAVDYPSLYGRDAPFYETLIAGTDPTLKMAMEKGDPVYDIQGTDLDFLSPSNIATGIGGLPLTGLSGMTFPQMAVKGAKIAALRGDFNAVVDRATAGKPIPKTFLLENGVKKITDAGDSTWFRITDPMYTELEGAMMGHSVGGYSRTDPYGLGKKEGGGKAAFNSGLAQVYSLRNSRTGKPSITVEMTGIGDGPLRITEIYGYKNGVPSPDEWDSVFKLAKEQRVDPSDMLENRGYGRDYNGEELPERFPVPWRQLYTGYLRAADEAPTKKAKGGSVERVYNDRKYI